MGLIPENCLSDAKISEFVNRINQTADKIVGDSKFEIPSPALPGLGLVIKLQVKTFEKTLSAKFAPILAGKKLIEEAFQKPLQIFKIIREGINDIKTLIENPIQFFLNRVINKNFEDFPFPIFLLWTPGSSGSQTSQALEDLISEPSVADLLYNYQILFENENSPEPGTATSQNSSYSTLQNLNVNYINQSGETSSALSLVQVGDFFSLNSENFSDTYKISGATFEQDFVRLAIQLVASSNSERAQEDQKVFVPGFAQASIGISRRINLRQFLTPNGLLLPLSILGINLPLISSISLELGNFNRLKEDNPTSEYVKKLEFLTKLNFSVVISDMVQGIFPKINWEEIQKKIQDSDVAQNATSGIKNVSSEIENVNSKIENAKLEMINLARFIQIGLENPIFLIKIILNYVKLIFLPLQVLISTFEVLASKIAQPIELIKTVFQVLSNPIKFFCDIISDAFLNFLEPYLGPPLAPLIPWPELRQDPIDKGRGLKPLFSDLICGAFGKKLAGYTPNENFFVQQSAELRTPSAENLEVQLSYDLTTNLIPEPGELSLESEILAQNTSMRFSSITNTVENGLVYLASLNVGDTFYLSSGNQFQNFKLSSKKLLEANQKNYFEYFVQPISQTETYLSPEQQQLQTTINGIVSENFKASITFKNPNKEFLFILEKYLPLKAITAWESIKGMFSLVVAIAAEIPVLFGLCLQCMVSFQNPANEAKSNLDLLADTGKSLIKAVESGNQLDEEGSYSGQNGREREAARDATREFLFNAIVDQNNAQEGGVIQNLFNDLQIQRSAENLPVSVNRGSANIPFNQRVKLLAEPTSYSLSDLGTRLEVMNRILFELTANTYSNAGDFVPKTLSPIVVYGKNVNGEIFTAANSSIFTAFARWNILIAGVERETENKFQVGSLRKGVVNNIRFINDILLPAILAS